MFGRASTFQHVCLCVLFLLNFFGMVRVPGASAYYSCPRPPAPGQVVVQPNDAFQAQPTYLTEWIFVIGSLCIVGADEFDIGSGDKPRQEHGKNGDDDDDNNRGNDNDKDSGSSKHWRGEHSHDPNSIVNDCHDPLGFQLTTINFNLSGGAANSPTNFIVTSNLVAITYGSTHYTLSNLGGAPVYPNPKQTFDRTFTSSSKDSTVEYKAVSGIAGASGSIYNFIAETSNVTMNLVFRAISPLLYEANGGYSGSATSPASCGGSYYVSVPQLDTSGIIRVNDKIFFVRGMSWMDHEWGSPAPTPATNSTTAPTNSNSSSTVGWAWMALRIGGVSVKLTVVHANNQFYPQSSRIDLMHPNGSMEHGVVTSLQVLSTWTSPLSKIVYPNHLTVTTNLPHIAELVLTPIFPNQEVSTVIPNASIQYYWEGDVAVAVVHGDGYGNLRGNGYLELEHIPPPTSS